MLLVCTAHYKRSISIVAQDLVVVVGLGIDKFVKLYRSPPSVTNLQCNVVASIRKMLHI